MRDYGEGRRSGHDIFAVRIFFIDLRLNMVCQVRDVENIPLLSGDLVKIFGDYIVR